MTDFQKLKNVKAFIFLLFIFSSFYLHVKGQNPDDYNKIYTKTYLEISQKDFHKALKIADSLFTISESPRFQAKSLMLSASLLQQSGEIKKSVDFALKADQILQDSEEYTWKAKISGFLASQYRHLKLTEQSKKYIDETLAYIKEIKDPKIANQTMGLVMQEKAYYDIERKNFKNSILSVNEAIQYFKISGQNNAFFDATNEQLLGLSYYHLKNYKESLRYYNSALDKLGTMPDNYMKGLILNGIAQNYIGKADSKKAKTYIGQALKIAEESKYLSLKKEIYTTQEDYYKLTKDIEKLENSKVKQDSITKIIDDNSAKFVSSSFSDLKEKNDLILKEKKNDDLVIAAVLVILIATIIYFFIYRKRQKKNMETIKRIVEEFKVASQSSSNRLNSTFKKSAEKGYQISAHLSQVSSTPLMTVETEQRILRKLEKFEQSGLFLKNSVSLPFLASYCHTNTKYLSHIVNSCKEKDFTNYINELRIRYIIQKLTEEPQYLKYKISALAEETGFSSQSKFSVAFKKVTSVTPSEFLQQLKKD
jgi:AraC-like DNA-binding protein